MMRAADEEEGNRPKSVTIGAERQMHRHRVSTDIRKVQMFAQKQNPTQTEGATVSLLLPKSGPWVWSSSF